MKPISGSCSACLLTLSLCVVPCFCALHSFSRCTDKATRNRAATSQLEGGTTRDDSYTPGARPEPASSGSSTRGLQHRLLIPPVGMMTDMQQPLAMVQQGVTDWKTENIHGHSTQLSRPRRWEVNTVSALYIPMDIGLLIVHLHLSGAPAKPGHLPTALHL